jgi:uncharacterized repeat protein (TIGR03803 family)
MKNLPLSRCALSITLTAVFAVACGSSPDGVPSITTLGVHGMLSPNIRGVYVFSGQPDGALPVAGLTTVNGILYGTTPLGGSAGLGTIFAVTTNGLERVEYSFHGSDGNAPSSELVNLNGTLYGTTDFGGSGGCTAGCGNIFAITSSGNKVWTYSFQGGTDGAYPEAGLVYVNSNNTLYGTTIDGGGSVACSGGCGTIFAFTSSGSERVITFFRGGTDGASPTARLINVNDTLYGTTSAGGRNGHGTVFDLDLVTGHERVLYSFAAGTDGATPYTGLVDVNGTLYGTTNFGGAGCGCGTIFAVTASSGTEKVIHSFAGGTDGAYPHADLIDVNGTLYGTTSRGGAHNRGTVFSVTLPSGTEKVIYAFHGGDDGYDPEGRLLNINRKLYGTTPDGGAILHLGNVFSLRI